MLPPPLTIRPNPLSRAPDRLSLQAFLLSALLLFAAGCKSDPAANVPPAPVPPVTLHLNQTPIVVEVASDERARLLHLRLKKELAAKSGLLLVFQSDDHFKLPTDNLFLTLDVVLLSSEGKVLDVRPMSAAHGREFESPVAARYALLLTSGAAAGVAAGQVIALPPEVGALAEPVRVPLQLGNQIVRLEVVASDALRQRGLMFRNSLPPDAGMIFVFPREQDQGFWMKDTRIPLDIVYLDRNGKIVSIKHMAPFDTDRTGSDGPAQFAIELNLGKAAGLGLKPGQVIALPESMKNPPDLEDQ